MIVDFSWASYNTTYTYNGKRSYRQACFGHGFPANKKENTLIIELPIAEREGKSFCFCNKEQVEVYVSNLAKEFGFKIKDITEDEKTIFVKVNFYNVTSRYGLLICTAIRYLYEYPYNVLTYCAIKNRDKFPELSLFNIVNYYIASSDTSWAGHKVGDDYSTSLGVCGKSFYNLSLTANSFNNGKHLRRLKTDNCFCMGRIKKFDTKCIDSIAHCINKEINKKYPNDKENICGRKR